MTAGRWNRRPKRSLVNTKDDELPTKIGTEQIFKVTRLRAKSKKRKHPGYTLVPPHRRWIFDNNKI